MPDEEGRKGRAEAYRQANVAWEAVIAVGVGMGVGWFIDDRFGTSPIFLMVFMGIGMYTGFKRLLSLTPKPPSDDGDPPAGS